MSFFLWNPTEDKPLPPKVPVTVFSGFLGSGKTTLLNHVLSSAASEKYAVVVNDLGEINIDAALIKNAFQDEDGPISGMLELQGGCICCSIQGDLLDAVFELWKRHQPAHILIEATGVAEPRSILETFYAGNYFGKRGTDFIEVANMVTVLDDNQGNHKSCGCGADHGCTEHASHKATQHHHKDYGLEAFVFNSRRLFSEEKFLNLLKAGLPGVLRAKGFYWADGAPDQVGLLSIAGKIMRADYLCDWWFTQIERGEAKVEDIPELVRSSWIPEYGDRRQELIFIGIDLDREFIQNSLIACYA